MVHNGAVVMATVCVTQIIKLLDGKRSQAVGILISSLHLEMKDIQQGELRSTSFTQLCFQGAHQAKGHLLSVRIKSLKMLMK